MTDIVDRLRAYWTRPGFHYMPEQDVKDAITALAQKDTITEGHPVYTLFADWIDAQLYVISETSGNTYRDWTLLFENAKERADDIGIEWSDDLIPEYIRNILKWKEED